MTDLLGPLVYGGLVGFAAAAITGKTFRNWEWWALVLPLLILGALVT